MRFHLSISVAFFAMLSSALLARPLNEAMLSSAVNEVTIAALHGPPRRAAEHEVIHADAGVRAGPQSRAEILFPDGTLARLGAETALGLRRGSRELTLERGTLLVEVPGFRGGARVRAGGLTAVCGAATILVEYLPLQSVKLVVLEGNVRVSVGGFLGDTLVIPPGKMLITTPDVKRIPDPVDVDLGTLVKTSALIDPVKFSAGVAPLASLPRIEREIGRQAESFRKQRLIPTNLAIVGSGTSVVIPGQPAAKVAEVAEGRSAVVGGRNESEARKFEGIAAHRSPAEPLDEENSLSNP